MAFSYWIFRLPRPGPDPVHDCCQIRKYCACIQMLFWIEALSQHVLGHYCDVIMTTMASQITSLTVVGSTVYSDVVQRKHQSSASLAFVWGIHRDRWIPRTKGQLRGKYFHLMTSSWWWFSWCEWSVCVCAYADICITISGWVPRSQPHTNSSRSHTFCTSFLVSNTNPSGSTKIKRWHNVSNKPIFKF